MSTQWHPLFIHLLGLLIEDYYKIDPEVPVSDLPRRADLLIIRRKEAREPREPAILVRLPLRGAGFPGKLAAIPVVERLGSRPCAAPSTRDAGRSLA